MATRYIAFLRAINVGGRTVKMDVLRQLFEHIGFSNVETFIASGNVIFETGLPSTRALEAKIGKALQEALGYDVAAFVRTDAQIAQLAAYKPFKQSALDSAAALNIAFIDGPLEPAAKQNLFAFKTDMDDFHVRDREIFWLCFKKQSESTFSNAVLEKAIGRRATMRGVNTIQRLAAKYPPS
jgi:uncharacterized protein (DUF1697 family)